jgi:hypothetical protein
MGNSGGRPENQNSKRNVDNEDWTRKGSDGNKDSTGNWTNEHSCYILAKNLSTLVYVLKH